MKKPSNGKVARLPHDLRHQLNTLLRDGLTHKQIVASLGDPVKHISPRNLSEWRKLGYKRWLEEQGRVDRIRHLANIAIQIAKEHEGAVIHQANLQSAASQIFEVLSDFDAKSLKDQIDGDPAQYTRICSILARLSENGLKFERYRTELAEKKEKLVQMVQKAKTAGMSEQEFAEFETMLNLM
jgi:hypothetical protein